MSTRCQITMKRDTSAHTETGNIYIYKHCDGYPEGVLPVLVPFVKAFCETRGDDACYMLAQIVREFAQHEEKERPGRKSFVGWGLDCVEHGDIEYLYEIDSATGKIYINGKEHQ